MSEEQGCSLTRPPCATSASLHSRPASQGYMGGGFPPRVRRQARGIWHGFRASTT